MRIRPLLAAFCLVLGLTATMAPAAHAQDAPSLNDLEKALGDATSPGSGNEGEEVTPILGSPPAEGDAPQSTTAPGGGVVPGSGADDDTPLPDALDPGASGATGDAGVVTAPGTAAPAPAAGSVTATPPGYLVPGQSAAVQPVSGVAELSAPQVPLDPVRLAGLIALALAALLIGVAVLLRSLGVRTAAPVAVVTAPPRRFRRTRDRTTLLADDVRDFLRRSR